MLDTWNRHVVQPLIAARRGSQHLRYLRLLERSQYESPEAIRACQLELLKGVLHHAYETVPYYRRTWDEAGVHPNDVTTLEALQYFPIVTKADLRKHEAEFLSTDYADRRTRVKRTSGSTGVPLTIRLDERGAQWKTACTLRSDEWSGWRRGQRVAKVWGNPEYLHDGWRGRLRNRIVDRAVYLDTIGLTPEKILAFAETLRQHRPGLIFGHAHSLYLVAAHWKKAGIEAYRPNGIISTAMPLHVWQRSVIEEVFGTPVTNRYGCEEVSLIACECEQHQGLHVAAESVYTEVLSQERAEWAPPGTSRTGPLVVTDLANAAMPLIRYQVGDVVTASDRVCACGRGLPLLESVQGREADYVVTPKGEFISGISLTENFALHIPGTAQIQIVQESLTELRLRIVPEAEFPASSRQRIAELVTDLFGPAMRHEIELVESIPQEPSGKYRFCISKVARDPLMAMTA